MATESAELGEKHRAGQLDYNIEQGEYHGGRIFD